MSAGESGRRLLDDCFLHDKDRMRHEDVVATLLDRLNCTCAEETVALRAANHRVAAEDIVAPRPVPLHENAAVDGFAFDHASYVAHAGRLRQVVRLAAGDTDEARLEDGQCARIFTGAVMPLGADTVAMQEDCTVEDGQVLIPEGLKKGANCRHAGEDVKQGAVVVEAGQVLRPQDVAALASLGLPDIKVRKPLRVAIVSTGNEIIEPGEKIVHGQVYNSNAPMLSVLAEAAGGMVTDFGIVRDDAQTVRQTLARVVSGHDMVLTTGGASRGEEDHVLAVLDALGKRHLWQIAIKPGRPMMFGQIGDSVVIGLPGNPVAAFVCFLLYVRTAMQALTGAKYREPVRYPVRAAFGMPKKKADRREFLRGTLRPGEDGFPIVDKYPRDGSGLISGLRAADGLIELGEDVTSVSAGDIIPFIPFTEFGTF
jgi:molybdopterin molybdotransferase